MTGVQRGYTGECDAAATGTQQGYKEDAVRLQKLYNGVAMGMQQG